MQDSFKNHDISQLLQHCPPASRLTQIIGQYVEGIGCLFLQQSKNGCSEWLGTCLSTVWAVFLTGVPRTRRCFASGIDTIVGNKNCVTGHCQWPQVVRMCLFHFVLNIKSRLDLLDLLDLLAPFLGAYCIILYQIRTCRCFSLSAAIVQWFHVLSLKYATLFWCIMSELAYLHFFEIPCSSTWLKIITEEYNENCGTYPPGFQQASCDKMTALQICFVTEGSFHPPFLAVGPFCSTPHALSQTTERLWFFFGLLIRLMH